MQNGSGQAGQGSLPKIPTGKNHLLIIAIDKYTNGLNPLNNAVRDAKAMRDLLWRLFQFDPTDTIELFDAEATRRNILRAFDDLAGRLTEEDNLVFYFSGHGQWVSEISAGYWIPVDGVSQERFTFLDNVNVQRLLKASRARHIFGIVDSCYSGSLFSTTREDVPLNPNAPPLGQYALKSRRILTSGQLQPVSDGPPGQHSPFANALLHHLEYGLQSGHIWSQKLCYEVTKNVPHNAGNQIPKGEPLQDAGHQGGDFIFLTKEAGLPVIVPVPPVVSQPVDKEPAEQDQNPVRERHPEPGNRLESVQQRLKGLIVKGNFRKFFAEIEGILNEGSEVNDEMILHQANYNSIQKDTMLLTQEQYNIAFARLRKALLYVINNLEETDLR